MPTLRTRLAEVDWALSFLSGVEFVRGGARVVRVVLIVLIVRQ